MLAGKDFGNGRSFFEEDLAAAVDASYFFLDVLRCNDFIEKKAFIFAHGFLVS